MCKCGKKIDRTLNDAKIRKLEREKARLTIKLYDLRTQWEMDGQPGGVPSNLSSTLERLSEIDREIRQIIFWKGN